MKSFLIFLIATAMLAQAPPNPQSRVAGRFVASSYGTWSIPLYTAPSGTGSRTFSISSTTVKIGDGRYFMPFSTNAPIFVGTEQVTPTAIGPGCILNAVGTGICTITATFVNKHSTLEPVTSATYGLQEALNDASLSGGGAVTIDSSWTALGGTTAIFNAATIPANTGIEDTRIGSPTSSSFPVLAPSGDTTGGTDGTAIAAACTAGKTLQLLPGTYYVGKSNTAVTLSAVCSIQGGGPGITIIQNEGTTNDVIVVNTANGPSGTTPTYPNPMTSGGTFSGFTIREDSGLAATAGAGLRVGTNTSTVTFGYTFTDIDVKGTYYGVRIDPGFWQNTFRNMVISNPVNQGVYFDSPSPNGDSYWDNIMLIGNCATSACLSTTPANFYINRADTNRIHAIKFNVGKFVFGTGSGGISNLQISDVGVEGAATCAFDFSAGNTSNYALVQIGNSEFETLGLSPFPICNPTGVQNLKVSNLCAGGSTSVSSKCFDYPIYGYYLYDDLNGVANADLANAESDNLQVWVHTFASVWSGTNLTLTGSGTVQASLTSGPSMYYASLTPATPNYTVTTPCTLGASGGGWCQAMGRITPGSGTFSGYACILVQGTGLELLKWSGAGTNAQLGSTDSTFTSGTHVIALGMLGTSLTCYRDGIASATATATDSTYTTAGNPAIAISSPVTGYTINGPVTVK
jgi:hypothetical protein